MYFKTLSFLLFSATAMALPQEENSYSSLMSEVDSLASNTQALNVITASSFPSQFASVAGIPASAAEAFASAVPSSFLQNIATDSAARSSLVQGIASSQYPSWYTSLPSEVQSQLATVTGDLTVSPTGTSTDAEATGSSASSSAEASSSTADSGAPAQTGAMAVSVAGAAGVLGLAFAL